MFTLAVKKCIAVIRSQMKKKTREVAMTEAELMSRGYVGYTDCESGSDRYWNWKGSA